MGPSFTVVTAAASSEAEHNLVIVASASYLAVISPSFIMACTDWQLAMHPFASTSAELD